MSESEKSNLPPRRCPACGTELPAGVPVEGCPKCLLQAGLGTQAALGPGGTVVLPSPAALPQGLPQPGEQFGHYKLLRVLGRGGMGVVYEAADLAGGRTVALKILLQALDSPDARKRFLREGQLAASINHPNSVYVYGTEEIAGTPVIAMELVAGGTLQERVARSGPLPVWEAVDGVLQAVAGLEAAQQIGILHRDIKPSNCFIDSEGIVKIGDFGLSITTGVRTESNLTEAGQLLGTPAFSAPEQLRGEELTVRSDIYAVGVTLYYLLTGHLPFAGANVVQLLANVLERRAETPQKWRPDIPGALARAILRCLEKNPGDRFRDYAGLREALLPFVSRPPAPASLGFRFLAGIIDLTLVAACAQLCETFIPLGWTPFYPMIFLYYAVLEGVWGASAGKALFRLRVVRPDRNFPGVLRALVRAVVFVGLWLLLTDLISLFLIDPHDTKPGELVGILFGLIQFALLGLMFSTARARNGLAGLHDWISRTRVVSQSPHPVRSKVVARPETFPVNPAMPQIGPYYVLDSLGLSDRAEMKLAYDVRLLRKVWLRQLPPGAPPVAAELRYLARPGRLRWLNGVRSETESWDAYEAASGRPLLQVISERQSWAAVRFWLLDLAEEFYAARHDGTEGVSFRLDQIWITGDGRAKQLDFSAPGLVQGGEHQVESNRSCPPPVPPAPGEFLRQIALSALAGRGFTLDEARREKLNRPVPLHARTFLENFGTATNLAENIGQLKLLLAKMTTVSRARRFALLAGGIWFPFFLTGVLVLFESAPRFKEQREFQALRTSLTRMETLEQQIKSAPPRKEKELTRERRQLQAYIAGRFAGMITNAATWQDGWAERYALDQKKALAERIVADQPQPSPAELAAATKAVEKKLRLSPGPGDGLMTGQPRDRILWALRLTWLYGIILVIVPCFLAALLFKGGALFRGLGIVLVTRDGTPASRGRVLWRNFLAWLPLLLLPLATKLLEPWLGDGWATFTFITALVALTGLLALRPERSLQDRLAGTFLVPR